MLALQLAALLLAAAPQKLDLVIEHGRVVDGSAAPRGSGPTSASASDRIAAIGDLRDAPAKLGSTPATRWWLQASSISSAQSELSVLLVDPACGIEDPPGHHLRAHRRARARWPR